MKFYYFIIVYRTYNFLNLTIINNKIDINTQRFRIHLPSRNSLVYHTPWNYNAGKREHLFIFLIFVLYYCIKLF